MSHRIADRPIKPTKVTGNAEIKYGGPVSDAIKDQWPKRSAFRESLRTPGEPDVERCQFCGIPNQVFETAQGDGLGQEIVTDGSIKVTQVNSGCKFCATRNWRRKR